MQIVKIQGGLGNQMFQYAFGYALHKKFEAKVCYDISLYNNQNETDTYTARDFLLKKAFGINPPLSDKNSLKFKMWFKIKKICGIKTQHFIDPEKGYINNIFKKNTFYNGYWQDEMYFKEYKNYLIKLYTPRSFTSNSLHWRKIIKECDKPTVSVHFRRGDYVQKNHVNSIHGVCDNEYYQKALDYLNNILNDYIIFVFSDDINWVKDNFNFKKETYFIDNIDFPWEEMYLQSTCQHNIIANSSFSWWGAWLNINPEKINIGPLKWYNDVLRNKNFKNILPDYFVKL